MNQSIELLALLAVNFAVLSLSAFGGANAVIPEIHRQSVCLHHWMSDQEFVDFFAISQAAPGPNVLIVTLVGWRAAGYAGALLSTACMCLPSGLLTCLVFKAWERFQDSPWRAAIQAGLAPITVGLIAASAFVIMSAAGRSPGTLALAAAVAVLAYCTKLNPLWLLAASAIAGAAGFV